MPYYISIIPRAGKVAFGSLIAPFPRSRFALVVTSASTPRNPSPLDEPKSNAFQLLLKQGTKSIATRTNRAHPELPPWLLFAAAAGAQTRLLRYRGLRNFLNNRCHTINHVRQTTDRRHPLVVDVPFLPRETPLLGFPILFLPLIVVSFLVPKLGRNF